MQNKKAQYKLENNVLEKVCIKNRTCYYFDDIINLKVFDLDDILIDEKTHKNIFMYGISNEILIGSKSLCIRFDKIDEYIRIYDGTRYLTLFGSEIYEYMILFTRELDIL